MATSNNMAPPKCPKHDIEMVKRKARRGPNEGNEFWGCPKYPKCKETIDVNTNRTTSGSSNPGNYATTTRAQYFGGPDTYAEYLTKEFEAREYRQGAAAHFFQNIGITYPILAELNRNPILRPELQRFAGWRVDLPTQGQEHNADTIKRALNGVLKILLRGKITLISPRVEEALKKYFDSPPVGETCADFSFLFHKPEVPQKTGFWMDGKGKTSPEREFYDNILPEVLNDHAVYTIPQVHLSSLISDDIEDTGMQQRVDFLLTDGENKLVIELDDATHVGHEDRDALRNLLASDGGFATMRIQSSDISDNCEDVIDELRSHLSNFIRIHDASDAYSRLLSFSHLIHQIEIIIILALSGDLAVSDNAVFYIDYKSLGLEKKDAEFLCHTIHLDMNEILDNYLALHDEPGSVDISLKPWDNSKNSKVNTGIVITQNDALMPKCPVVFFQNTFLPYNISVFIPSDSFYADLIPDKEKVLYFLNLIFRKTDFMEGQYETIERALRKEDTVVLLPTGGGKSISFQLSAFLLPGVALVVSPIVSLMDDQVDNLQRIGIDRIIAISSQIRNPATKTKLINEFGRHEYLLAYITPERMQTIDFRDVLKSLSMYSSIPLVAIDEAHCVSEWGHDFRTSYLNIGRISREFCRNDNGEPCILALTGTASSAVLKDVQRELQIPGVDTVITPKSFDRPELHYRIVQCTTDEKPKVLQTILDRKLPADFSIPKSKLYSPHGESSYCGIVFCPHVDGPHGIEFVRKDIAESINIRAEIYGGHAPRGLQEAVWNLRKREVATGFKNNIFTLMCTTKAFGMGIDKPNIRYTIHYGLAPSIEAFYQEVGRAGRDREKSMCYMIASVENEFGYSSLFNFKAQHSDLELVQKGSGDDVSRVLRFHTKAFIGIQEELKLVRQTLEKLDIGSQNIPNRCTFTVKREQRNDYEKALHRLVILGVVSDYTLDYSSNEFGVKISGIDYDSILSHYREYVAGYNTNRVPKEISKIQNIKRESYSDFTIQACEVLIAFIYDTIEKGRRRALKEMYDLTKKSASAKNTDDIVRQGILRYLESSFSVEIDNILESEDLGFSAIRKLMEGYENEIGEMVGGIRSQNDAADIRAQVGRYLESTPDHPGLLFLRSLSELYCPNYDTETVIGNFLAAIDSAKELYDADEEKLSEFIIWSFSKFEARDTDICEECIKKTIESHNDLELSAAIIKSSLLRPVSLYYPILHYMSDLSEQVINIFGINERR